MAGGVQIKHLQDGVVAGRLGAAKTRDNFQDIHPPLSGHEALVASDRCYFCYDAPCVTACPTAIDIPLFIRQIAAGNTNGAANTIFDQNILGGMCARVCPTETLCEQACVREEAEGKPVKIGLLQRFATDQAMAEEKQFYSRAKPSGKSVAVVGAGPAGLACAHRLAMHGHAVTIYEARKKPGGLNEFGIAAYKAVDNFAQSEVDYVTAIGGIAFSYGKRLGRNISIAKLQADHDAVFLGVGLDDVNGLGLKGVDHPNVVDAVEFIANLRQAKNKSKIAVGRNIVVIGGGLTAIDAAVQVKLLGAESVTICYRRGQAQMNASRFEQDLATQRGVVIRTWMQPKKLTMSKGELSGIQLEYTEQAKGKLAGTGQTAKLVADQVFLAIGQSLRAEDLVADNPALALDKGRIKTDAAGQTSLADVWAGGDCTNSGDDLTVTAVAQGRDAAMSIHAALTGQGDL
ncbi:MAG: NAD(P)-dependent oxidoreductase [Alphaproteobacteria bacterium]|nr:NAD(P)-dependent oxidoreductase [Alphaproteobacteria bacterium]